MLNFNHAQSRCAEVDSPTTKRTLTAADIDIIILKMHLLKYFSVMSSFIQSFINCISDNLTN